MHRQTFHPLHQELLADIQSLARLENIPLDQGNRYVGTSKPVYLMKSASIGAIYRDFTRRHPDLSPAEYISLLDSLSQGETYNEYTAVGVLLNIYPKLRKTLDPWRLDRWLEHAQGWAEVDTICQTNFTASEMLSDWETWSALLSALAGRENIHQRRASLVLLTRPLRESDDPRLSDMAFANVERLKHEKEILITKAVSWILRALIKHHRLEVDAYLDAQAEELPKIAVRETRNVLVGGVKKKTA
jgi:3-methyladenine DNA glycosylase AlkD